MLEVPRSSRQRLSVGSKSRESPHRQPKEVSSLPSALRPTRPLLVDIRKYLSLALRNGTSLAECCMSGCATCVYDLYLDDLEHFHSQVREAKRQILNTLRAEAAGTGAPVDLSGWPESQLGPPPTLSEMSDATPYDNNGSDTTSGPPYPAEVAEREAAEARKQISDPTLRAFLEMEARMKKKQQDQQKKEARAATPVPAP